MTGEVDALVVTGLWWLRAHTVQAARLWGRSRSAVGSIERAGGQVWEVDRLCGCFWVDDGCGGTMGVASGIVMSPTRRAEVMPSVTLTSWAEDVVRRREGRDVEEQREWLV